MKFIHAVFALFAIVSSVFATPAPYKRLVKRGVDPSRIPAFGVTAGIPVANSASCAGIPGPNGPILIPCSCPPDRNQFIADLNANVAAGHCINNTGVSVPPFPEDDSVQSQLKIFNIATVTLQNLYGPGKGCPQAATTWGAQVKELQGAANSAPPASTAALAASASPATSTTPATSACPAAPPPS